MPPTVPQLLATNGFHGRAAKREAPRWLRCVEGAARAENLPPLHLVTNAPPPPRVWPDRDPVAAARLATAKARLATMAGSLGMPVENLLTPDTLRRLAWRPPQPINADAVAERLHALGARNWQVEMAAATITDAFLDPAPLPAKGGKKSDDETVTESGP